MDQRKPSQTLSIVSFVFSSARAPSWSRTKYRRAPVHREEIRFFSSSRCSVTYTAPDVTLGSVRFNGKEDNLVLWTFKSGKRSFVKKGVHEVPLKMGEWHRMKIAVSGTQLRGFLDDELLLEYTLAEPVTGKIGVWSKTDSVSQFDAYEVRKTQ